MEDREYKYVRFAVRQPNGWEWATNPMPYHDKATIAKTYSQISRHWHPAYFVQVLGDEEDILTDEPPQDDLEEPSYNYYPDDDGDEADYDEVDADTVTNDENS